MKIRTDFVTNSSSSSFIITNKTKNDKTLVDFVEENPELIEEFKREYYYEDDSRYTQDAMIRCAQSRDEIFPANSSVTTAYGDEDGDVLGKVFDYILRDGGTSKSFRWEFNEHLR